MDRFLIIDLWIFGVVIFVLGFVYSANLENLDDVTDSENFRMGNEIRPIRFEENSTNIHSDEFDDADEMHWRTEMRTHEDRSLPDLSMLNLQMDPVAYWAAIYGTEDVPEFDEPPEIEGDSIFLDFGDLDEDENVPAKVLVKRAAELVEEDLDDPELTLRKMNRRRQRVRGSRKHRTQSSNWNYQSVMSAGEQQSHSHAESHGIRVHPSSENSEGIEFCESNQKHVEFGAKASSRVETSLGRSISSGVVVSSDVPEHNSVSSHRCISNSDASQAFDMLVESKGRVLDAKKNLLHTAASGSSKAELNDAIHRTIEAKKDLLDSVIGTGSQIIEAKKDCIHSHLEASPVVTTKNTVLENLADSTSKVLSAKENLLHAVASGSGRVEVNNAIHRTIEAKKDLLDSVIGTGSQILKEQKEMIGSHLEASPVVTTIIDTIADGTKNTVLENVVDSTSKVLDAKQNLLHAVASGSSKAELNDAIHRTIEAKKDLLDSVIGTGSQILDETKDLIHSHFEASPVVTTIVGKIVDGTRNTVSENVVDSTSRVLDAKKNLAHVAVSGNSKTELNDAIHRTIEAKKDLLDSVIETGSQIVEAKKDLINSNLEASQVVTTIVGKIVDGTKNTVLENVADSTSKVLDAKQNLLHAAASGSSNAELNDAIRRTIEAKKDLLDSVIGTGSQILEEKTNFIHSHLEASPVVTTIAETISDGTRNTVLENVADSASKVLDAKQNLLHAVASGSGRVKVNNAIHRTIEAKKDLLDSVLETGSRVVQQKTNTIHSHLASKSGKPVRILDSSRSSESTSKVLDAKKNLLLVAASGGSKAELKNAIHETIEAKKSNLLDSIGAAEELAHVHSSANAVKQIAVEGLESVAESKDKIIEAKKKVVQVIASGGSKTELHDAFGRVIEAKKNALDSLIPKDSISTQNIEVISNPSSFFSTNNRNCARNKFHAGTLINIGPKRNATTKIYKTIKICPLDKGASSLNRIEIVSADSELDATTSSTETNHSTMESGIEHAHSDQITTDQFQSDLKFETSTDVVTTHPADHFTISGSRVSNMELDPPIATEIPIEIFHSYENDGIIDDGVDSLVMENEFEISKSFGKASSNSEDVTLHVKSTDSETADTDTTVNNAEACSRADSGEENMGADGYGIRYEGDTEVTVKVNDAVEDNANGGEVVEDDDSSEENTKDDEGFRSSVTTGITIDHHTSQYASSDVDLFTDLESDSEKHQLSAEAVVDGSVEANSHRTSFKTRLSIDGHIGAQTSGGDESIDRVSETTDRISILRNKTRKSNKKHASTHRLRIADSISGNEGVSQILVNYEACMSGLFNVSRSNVDLEFDLYSTASEFELQCVNASLRHIFHSSLPIIEETVQKCLQYGKEMAIEMQGRPKSFGGKGLFRNFRATSMLQYLETMLAQAVADKHRNSELFLFGTRLLLRKSSLNFDISPKMFVEFLKRHVFCVTGKTICEAEPKRCPSNLLYRTIDGSCNNEHHPSWGQSNTIYARLLPARYADGIYEPPLSVTGAKLPNVRDLSVAFFSRRTFQDPKITLAVMQWGQMLSHDMARQTTVRILEGVQCCTKDGRVLPKKLRDPACMPIAIRPDDIFYSKYNQQCMNFVRSIIAPRDDNTPGPAEQLNGVTSYLDLSTVYGSDKESSDALRTFQHGQLLMEWREGHVVLPTTTNRSVGCDAKLPKEVCYIAGDVRVNQNPELAVMHTLMAREHNRIAFDLHSVNPHWNEERLFQETRRIVIAEYQYITYNEWLPLILGNKYCQKYRLTSSQRWNYDPRVNPSILNDFSTGAFRLFHSMVDGAIELCPANRQISDILRLSDYFFRPQVIEESNNFDDLVRGLVTQPSLARGDRVHPEIGEYLFRSSNAYGRDLAALDMQRGRDHGLQGYNAYREICGLRRAETFGDLIGEIPSEKIEKLAQYYAHVDDIDLVVGIALETNLRGCLVGPTLRCLTAEQFYRSKVGDRHFYDNADQPHPFTREQIEEIEKASLARLLCDTSDDLKTIQVEAFKQISQFNSLTNCDFLPRINLLAWQEYDRQKPLRCC